MSYGVITTDYLTSGQYHTPIYHMDIEVYKPYWSIIIRHRGKSQEFTSDNPKLQQLRKIVRDGILTAYNAKYYDLKILYAILNELPTKVIYMISKALVEGKYQDNPLVKPYLRYKYWGMFKFIDILDDLTGSLKEHEANMGIEIVESSVDWDVEHLTDEQKKLNTFYNNHDVVAQEKIFKKRIEPYLQPKIILAELYNLDPIEALKDTNAKLTAKILGARRLPEHMLIDEPYKIPKHVKNYINKYVPQDIVNLYQNNKMGELDDYKINVEDFENTGYLGSGGIHTVLKTNLRVTNRKFKLFLIDVKSYYPNLLIHFDLLSRAVRNPKIFPEIYENRLKAKRVLDKILDKAFKLILNTVTGASEQEFNPLYDPNRTRTMRITGQLLLYALAKELWSTAGCKVVQANTDGILVAIKQENITKMKKLVTNWENLTKLEMEYDEIEVFAQANVNNYACKFTNGLTKVKGSFCLQAYTADESAFQKITWNNYDMRVVHEAVFRYLIYGDSIEKTIKSCNKLMNFISTTKTGKTYDRTFHYIDNKEIEVQKVNRVVAVKNKRYGTLKKFKDEDGKPRYDKIAKISNHVFIMNKDMKTYKWDTWKDRIDYDFYINVAKKKVKGFVRS